MRLVSLALVFAAIATVHADSHHYTLADLRALVDARAYAEAVQHLGDVAPASRKDDWIDVAGRACAGLVATADEGDRFYHLRNIEDRYPQVLKSPAYLAARADAAPGAFAACFRDADFADCRDFALRFVDGDPKNAKLTLAMAKIVRRGMSTYFAAVPFFKRALAANKPGAVCGDDDFELAVVSGLGLDASDVRLADTLAIATTCWTEMREVVVRLTWKTGEVRDHACELLRARRALTPETAQRCAGHGK
jgi:hypothetical protein